MNAGVAQFGEHRDSNSEGATFESRPPAPLILAGHQPVYLPGIIVMTKIALADRFMFCGHCDYQSKSWHTRNYICGPRRGIHTAQPLMLSVPVRAGLSINETKPLPGSHWRQRHLRSIWLAYHKRPYFSDYYDDLWNCLMQDVASLSELNIGLTRVLMDMLGIDTPTFQSEDFNVLGHKTKMLVSMCEAMGAQHYLSSPGEAAYVRSDEMNGYAHSFLKFTHPLYEQGSVKFTPNLSVIDLLFNCGPAAGKMVREAGSV